MSLLWRFKNPPSMSPQAWAVTRFLRHLVLRPLARLKVYQVNVAGRTSVPKHGGVIVACNHPSPWDPVVLAGALSRNAAFYAKAELWRKPILGAVLTHMGQIPVDRGNRTSGSQAQAAGIKVLTYRRAGHPQEDRGGLVTIFPEGGCSAPDGTLKPFKKGVWYLALETGCPVVPAGIRGTAM